MNHDTDRPTNPKTEAAIRRRHARRAEGLCATCVEVAEPGATYCARHLESNREKQRRHREKTTGEAPRPADGHPLLAALPNGARRVAVDIIFAASLGSRPCTELDRLRRHAYPAHRRHMVAAEIDRRASLAA